jgi:hypothetical protein
MIFPLIIVGLGAAGLARVLGGKVLTVGSDTDTLAPELESFVGTGMLHRAGDEPSADFFDASMWITPEDVSDEELDALDEAIGVDAGRYATSECDLWRRPALVGDCR